MWQLLEVGGEQVEEEMMKTMIVGGGQVKVVEVTAAEGDTMFNDADDERMKEDDWMEKMFSHNCN